MLRVIIEIVWDNFAYLLESLVLGIQNYLDLQLAPINVSSGLLF